MRHWIGSIEWRVVFLYSARIIGSLALVFYALITIRWVLVSQDFESLREALQDVVELTIALLGLLAWLVRAKPQSEQTTKQAPEQYVRHLLGRAHEGSTLRKRIAKFISLPLNVPIRAALAEEPSVDRQLGIQDAIGRFYQFLLIGDPGSGKTTTLWYALAQQAEAYLSATRESAALPPMPFYIDLGDRTNPPEARQLLQHHWDRAGIQDDLDEMLRNERLWLFLDGLNEMPDNREGRLKDRAESLLKFIGEEYKGRVLLTCRVADFEALDLETNLPTVRILRLGEEEILEFAGRLEDSERIDAFFEALGHRGPSELATNPLSLKMLLDVFEADRELPKTQAALFERFVEMIYERDREKPLHARVRRDLKILKKRWQKLAYHMFVNEGSATTLDEKRARLYAADFRLGRWQVGGKQNLEDGIRLDVIERRRSQAGAFEIKFFHETLRDHFALPLVEASFASRREMRWLIRLLGRLETKTDTRLWFLLPFSKRSWFRRQWYDFLNRQASQVLDYLEDARRRTVLIERIGRLETQAVSALPLLAKLYTAEAYKDNAILYGNILLAAITIVGGIEVDVANRLILAFLTEAELRLAPSLREHSHLVLINNPGIFIIAAVLDLVYTRAADSVHDRVLTRSVILDLARDLSYVYAYSHARSVNIAFSLVRAGAFIDDLGEVSHEEHLSRAAELGLEPFDPDKIETRRRELLAELPGLAAEVVRAYEAGELN